MAETENELRQLAQRMMKESWDYKSQTKKYVRQVMGVYDQGKLMALLDDLNYKELKMIAGCGIPGSAWRYSVDLLEKKKRQVDLFIEQDGQNAKATVEHEDLPEVDKDGSTRI